jgi:hypothetical protein
MSAAFHQGILYDGRQSTYYRPAHFEAARAAPGFKSHHHGQDATRGVAGHFVQPVLHYLAHLSC